MEVLNAENAEHLLIAVRWPDEPSCPTCSSGARLVAGGDGDHDWSTWRCADCRKRFTVTTGTEIHSTKLAPAAWLAAASLPEPTPANIVGAISVSLVTARKISSVMQPVKSDSLPERLRHLLRDRRRREPTADPWQIERLPATLHEDDNPLVPLSNGTKSVLNALRARPFGATAAKLAELADVSYSQTSRCLIELERRGWAEKSTATVQHGYELRPATLWELSWSTSCMEALSFLRERPTRRVEDAADRVPQRFWRNFWSGASADTLRISLHGLHIAETLIGGRDVCARAWALSTLPASVLQECRTLRGFDTGPTAELLDAEMSRRAATA
ncbi:helix-turn-helix domain-containing protein [Candidatus Poriferisodalis sp.]|uniref:helix-turn-helix domain-containing protein n=1 Tax=Candidatus Poriferisodalis sp. TaxID=3101277 RepID=UPI003B0226C7